MIQFNNPPLNNVEDEWRYKLDQFVEENQESLAAVSWGLHQEWGNTKETLGIDLKPSPHFVCCSREALETLNKKVNRKVQEILGILDGYDPREEVAIIGIGNGQIKLVYFKPETSPPDCYAQSEQDLDTLIGQLEQKMAKYLSL
ncbi:hypothetical protein C7H19_18600 [Aphanothece hegewaldii CCALA 016]|uniref:Chaperone protein CcmS domain-containing protein n=1 Tax=Aphanothece hegewaldii CCALA 016 TaxID=2107694 RepID=A0A2T1LTY4_9CHRO|nr:hypothetical protein [Aphanothece hegewaldii]PSF34576.1 hypothetical protein C7H19_18600 [Aphanothece hegewaldii CCALA 016]